MNKMDEIDSNIQPGSKGNFFERLALLLTSASQNWVPDSFIFALIITICVFLWGLLIGETPIQMATFWGSAFWNLLTFGMQMVLIIVGGFVLATAPVIRRFIDRLAGIPRSERGAFVFCALVAIVTNWINWGFSLIFCCMLALSIARKFPKADYRLLGFCAFVPMCLGIGQNGISGSAALLIATPGSLPPALFTVLGHLIPVTETVFRWQTIVFSVVQFITTVALVWLMAPTPLRAVSAADLGVDIFTESLDELKAKALKAKKRSKSFAAGLEDSPILIYLIGTMGLLYVVLYFTKGIGLAGVNLNVVNFMMLMVGMVLHGTPRSLIKSVSDAVTASHGVVLQFPFYAGIFGMIAFSPIGKTLSDCFVGLSNHATFPAIVALYSGLMGLIVPSAGSKFVLEAPYIMGGAHMLNVSAAWTAVCYGYGEALANCLQPFWMVPLLGIMKLHPKHLVGYGIVLLCVMTPLVFVLSLVLGMTVQQ